MYSSLAVVLLLAAAGSAKFVPRIYGGDSVQIETYPYQVSIQWNNRHNCGGSIISPYWILTAGHCVFEYELAETNVRAGTSYVEQGGTVHRAAKIIKHSRFGINSHGSAEGDIALIKLADPIIYDEQHQPIEMFEQDEETAENARAIVSGWGQTPTTWKPSQLQAVVVPIISKRTCSDLYYEKFGPLPSGEICALVLGVGGKDACVGDSGGPLAVNQRLAGVVSWGEGCAKPYQPGVYTEVAFYRNWIEQVIREN
ncbi:hypothetical protein TKK_0002445 [Trichogramma kaykai]|uniref:Peptidase S1 domain-containing protein n=1 Tax=Trichogramma kaykai TaxID=54128 RepID=A0ABD2VXE2_9HYME